MTGEVIVKAGDLISESDVEAIEAAGIDSVMIRSVLTCETAFGICAKCYGRDLARGRLVNQGEAVGVIAAQSIGEPGTQLTMRTFHIGGTAQRGAEQSSLESPYQAKVTIKNKNIVKNGSGAKIVLARNSEIVLLDDQDREKFRHRIPYGSRILVDEGDKVKAGQRLVEWDPYTIPIITERDGVVHFVDLVEGVSIREIVDESTGLSNRVVVDWKQQARGSDLRPMLSIRDKDGNPVILPNGMEARYFLTVDSILSTENNAKVRAGDILARIPQEKTKTRDITGGLPRVSELVEARHPKDAAIIAEFDGRVEYGKDYKAKRRIFVIPTDEALQPMEYLVPKGRHITVHEGDYVKKGDLLVDGSPVPHDILRILGIEALATYIVSEIQQVYRLQGVRINDKHIEVIARQMLQKYEVTDPGETILIRGEQIDRSEFEQANREAMTNGLKPASGIPILQGITKASLQTKSFFAAASFQETTRVLTEAAVSGKVDALIGLKENVIVGRLIPAGTGSIVHNLRKLAAERDRAASVVTPSEQELIAQQTEQSGDMAPVA
jgi:DNA-directed RNA polymerase subunit beta'